MKIFYLLIFVTLLIGCKNDCPNISYNPFEPNYNLNTDEILKNGFVMKWADGGINTYSLNRKNNELLFFEDGLNPGKIIGETYDFHIDSIKNYDWELDSLFIDFKHYRDTIISIVNQFNAKLIEPIRYTNYSYLKFNVQYKNDSIFECRICCAPDGILNLTIENWYKK
jgi:hypothetical protein